MATPKQALAAWSEAANAYHSGDTTGALRLFLPLARLSKPAFNAGMAYLRLADLSAADCMFSAALAADPYLAAAFLCKAYTYFVLQDYTRAVRCYNMVLELLLENDFIDYTQLGLKYRLYRCEVYFNRAMCYHIMDDTAKCLADLITAQRSLQTQNHKDIIGTAARVGIMEITLFTVPFEAIFEVPDTKVKNMDRRDYLKDAKVLEIATGNASSPSDSPSFFAGFTGAAILDPSLSDLSSTSASSQNMSSTTLVRSLSRANSLKRTHTKKTFAHADLIGPASAPKLLTGSMSNTNPDPMLVSTLSRNITLARTTILKNPDQAGPLDAPLSLKALPFDSIQSPLEIGLSPIDHAPSPLDLIHPPTNALQSPTRAVPQLVNNTVQSLVQHEQSSLPLVQSPPLNQTQALSLPIAAPTLRGIQPPALFTNTDQSVTYLETHLKSVTLSSNQAIQPGTNTVIANTTTIQQTSDVEFHSRPSGNGTLPRQLDIAQDIANGTARSNTLKRRPSRRAILKGNTLEPNVVPLSIQTDVSVLAPGNAVAQVPGYATLTRKPTLGKSAMLKRNPSRRRVLPEPSANGSISADSPTLPELNHGLFTPLFPDASRSVADSVVTAPAVLEGVPVIADASYIVGDDGPQVIQALMQQGMYSEPLQLQEQQVASSPPLATDLQQRVKVKVVYGDQAFALLLQPNTRFTSFIMLITSKVRGNNKPPPQSVCYLDEEGTMISVVDDDDLHVALSSVRENGSLYVQCA